MVWLLECVLSAVQKLNSRGVARLSPFVKREFLQPLLLISPAIYPSPFIVEVCCY